MVDKTPDKTLQKTGYWDRNGSRKVLGVEFKKEITPLGLITLVTLIAGGLFAWWDFTSLAEDNAEDLKSHIERKGHDGMIEFSHQLDNRLGVIERQLEQQEQSDKRIERQLDRLLNLELQQQHSPYIPYRGGDPEE